jgi:D-galactose 1-dehydrogenase
MIRIAIIGAGKIARDQHVPTITASPDFELAAAVTLGPPLEGVPNFRDIGAMMRAVPGVTAAAICTPPRGRLALAHQALDHGLDLLIEKPPAATLAEAGAIAAAAQAASRVLFAAWHSRTAAAVEPARAWLQGKTIRSVAVIWKEDVRVWHPGQEWIWEPGIGVFDPGINALSVVTHLLPRMLVLQEAELRFPENRAAPIAATLAYDAGGTGVRMAFDFDQRGPQTWDIDIVTDEGTLKLSMGAGRMAIDGVAQDVGAVPEYTVLYQHFARLLKDRCSDADFTPLKHVADAFLLGRRTSLTPFHWA